MSEFGLIRRHFADLGATRADVVLGVGDDAALVQVPAQRQLVLAVDTLLAGVHFPENTPAEAIGHKALAVNLSDLAAMGAEPAWAILALSLPHVDEAWLAAFCRGFHCLAQQHGVRLVGGDTTRGPLAVTVQISGFVTPGRALRRSGARVGDFIYVTGPVGDAGLGLKLALGELDLPPQQAEACLRRLHRPSPRVSEGQALLGLASAAIDISDGLLADLGHILQASGVGARLWAEHLPLSQVLRQRLSALGGWRFPLTAGDDYELCFTAPPERAGMCEDLLRQWGWGGARIGVIEAERGLRWESVSGQVQTVQVGGYDHFG